MHQVGFVRVAKAPGLLQFSIEQVFMGRPLSVGVGLLWVWLYGFMGSVGSVLGFWFSSWV